MGWRLAAVVSLIQGTKEVYACLLLPFFFFFFWGGGGGGLLVVTRVLNVMTFNRLIELLTPERVYRLEIACLSFHFSSRWYLCARKSPYAFHPVSQRLSD